MIVISTMRYRRTSRDIEDAEVRVVGGTTMDTTLVSLLLGLGIVLFMFLLYTVVHRMI